MDDDDGEGNDGNGDGIVEEQVFDYSELLDLCDAHLQKTSYEHYLHHHVEVLDVGNTDDYDEG